MAGRVSQLVVESATVPLGRSRVSQVVLETVVGPTGRVRVSQQTLETLVLPASRVRVSQVVVEALVVSRVYTPVTLYYPTLVGLSFSVVKRPKYSTGIGTGQSGREVRVQYWQAPMWEWDLTYEYLPDKPANGTTISDLKTLMSFFAEVGGAAQRFFFQDPDDCTVVGQAIGTGDGSTTNFGLVRSFGAGGFSTTEPVGTPILTDTFNVYVNGVLVSPSTYTVNTSTPVATYVSFTSPPAAGYAVAVDMTFAYLCRFKEDTYDFEKFFDKLWSQKTLTLFSLRG